MSYLEKNTFRTLERIAHLHVEVAVDLLVRSLQSKVADLAKELQGLKDETVCFWFALAHFS